MFATDAPPHTILRDLQNLSPWYRPTPVPGKALPQLSAFIWFSLGPDGLKACVSSQPNLVELRVYVSLPFSYRLPLTTQDTTSTHIHPACPPPAFP